MIDDGMTRAYQQRLQGDDQLPASSNDDDTSSTITHNWNRLIQQGDQNVNIIFTFRKGTYW